VTSIHRQLASRIQSVQTTMLLPMMHTAMNVVHAAVLGPGYHEALPTQPTTRSLDVHGHGHVLLEAPAVVPQVLEEHLFC